MFGGRKSVAIGCVSCYVCLVHYTCNYICVFVRGPCVHTSTDSCHFICVWAWFVHAYIGDYSHFYMYVWACFIVFPSFFQANKYKTVKECTSRALTETPRPLRSTSIIDFFVLIFSYPHPCHVDIKFRCGKMVS